MCERILLHRHRRVWKKSIYFPIFAREIALQLDQLTDASSCNVIHISRWGLPVRGFWPCADCVISSIGCSPPPVLCLSVSQLRALLWNSDQCPVVTLHRRATAAVSVQLSILPGSRRSFSCELSGPFLTQRSSLYLTYVSARDQYVLLLAVCSASLDCS